MNIIGDKETNTVRSEMQAPYRLLQASARNIAKVFKDAKLECDEEEYVKGFNAGKYCSTYMKIYLVHIWTNQDIYMHHGSSYT
jgi:nitrate reductase assembly molybdenum cofactor insertion protein NarJ